MALTELHTSSSVDTEAVDQQLEKLLTSHHFCHSQRYPALLKYLVQQTQLGQMTALKERLLGIEVFHRPADYDTNADPVVRVTAAEVRKRIAQYYQEPEHTLELRIELPVGSYIPRFLPPRQPLPAMVLPPAASMPSAVSEQPIVVAPALDYAHGPAKTKRGGWAGLLKLAGAALFGAALVVAGAAAYRWNSNQQEKDVRNFWAPLDNGRRPILVVVGDHSLGKDGKALKPQAESPNPAEVITQQMNRASQVTIKDVLSLYKIADYLVRHDISYHAAGAGLANLEDLRSGPVVLFAGLDNRWTMRMCSRLRYRFIEDPDDTVGVIEDAKDPSRRWIVDFNVPYSKLPLDYAIVARYFDPLLEQPVIVAAGIGETGTAAASEFVTQERFLQEIAPLAPRGWKNGNVELVIATQVVDGHPGPPHIVAAEFW